MLILTLANAALLQDFPRSGQGRATLQIAIVLHSDEVDVGDDVDEANVGGVREAKDEHALTR